MTTTDNSPPTQRKQLKAFGSDEKKSLIYKEEALRTLPRQECFDLGFLTVKDLDDEELRYGRCRDKNGYIPEKHGKRTILIPQERYDEMVAEHELRFKQKLRQALDEMFEVVVEIAKDDTVEPRDRLDGAKYLMDRVLGKTPEHVSVSVNTKPWEDLLQQVTGIAPMSRAEHRALNGAGIVDAEVVEDDSTSIPEAKTEDPVQPEGVSQSSEDTAEPPVVPVHQARPSEQPELPARQEGQVPHQGQVRGEKPDAGEQYYEHVDVPVGAGDVLFRADNTVEHPGSEQRADVPDNPQLGYGRRADEKRSYADQARAAEDLANRRKEQREKIQNAKRQRKIARIMGADAIKDEITGVSLTEDGKLTFDIE